MKKSTCRILSFIAIISFTLLFSKFAGAATILTVGTTGVSQVLTVGTTGAYSTIQSAISAVISGADEIRVSQGTYNENILISSAVNFGIVNITGGWDSTFSNRNKDNTLTTIDGGSANCVFKINISATGSIILTLDGFTLQNGGNNHYGSGIRVEVNNESQIIINNNRIIDNVSSGPNSITGGGIYAYLGGSGNLSLDLTNNLIQGNSILSTGSTCTGAGMALSLHQDAVFNVTGNIIETNSSTSDVSNQGIGVYISKHGSGICDFSNNIVRSNKSYGTGSVVGTGGFISVDDTGTLTMSQNQWLYNLNYSSNGEDLCMITDGTSTLKVSDSLIAGAKNDGAQYHARAAGSTIMMTNLTITDNTDYGLNKTTGPGAISLYNTIFYNNGTDYDSLPVDIGNNLIGSDPRFVNSASQNYRLTSGSPAINAGTNSPTGGLGTVDLDGNVRIFKSIVDIGAYEYKPSFSPGTMLLLIN